MRLIGIIDKESDAVKFSAFLTSKGIENSIHQVEKKYECWIVSEDDIIKAVERFKEFKKDSYAPQFNVCMQKQTSNSDNVKDIKQDQDVSASVVEPLIKKRFSLTRCFIAICVILFIWNWTQLHQLTKTEGAEIVTTPLMDALSYEEIRIIDQKSGEGIFSTANWKGFYQEGLERSDFKALRYDLLFQQIRNGQIWRLFTPVLLHAGVLHILFNMLWLWSLGRQIEDRISKWRYVILTVIIGVISNTCQYLMSGPLFMGYSGVVCGLAGFIWVRQRDAPWEGYPLDQRSLYFLLVFIFAMMGVQVVSFILEKVHIVSFSMNIANTAHISGLLTGVVLAKVPILYKGGG